MSWVDNHGWPSVARTASRGRQSGSIASGAGDRLSWIASHSTQSGRCMERCSGDLLARFGTAHLRVFVHSPTWYWLTSLHTRHLGQRHFTHASGFTHHLPSFGPTHTKFDPTHTPWLQVFNEDRWVAFRLLRLGMPQGTKMTLCAALRSSVWPWQIILGRSGEIHSYAHTRQICSSSSSDIQAARELASTTASRSLSSGVRPPGRRLS